jgi:hypothetical protein
MKTNTENRGFMKTTALKRAARRALEAGFFAYSLDLYDAVARRTAIEKGPSAARYADFGFSL